MPSTDLLKQFGLYRNPFTDRTAEKTFLDDVSLYVQSDLRDFTPSETTYVFFGRRGSGKTTIRLQMERAYKAYNDAAEAEGRCGHFVVDLCRPGHMTACLRKFQDTIHATTENWDAVFSERWSSADLVDCILSYAATELVNKIVQTGTEASRARSAAILSVLRSDERAGKQFLVLAHLYAQTDASTLAYLSRTIMQPKYTALQISGAVAIGGAVAGGVTAATRDPVVVDAVMTPLKWVWDHATQHVPFIQERPKLALGVTAGVAAASALYYSERVVKISNLRRAAEICAKVRVVEQQPVPVVAGLVNHYFSRTDNADTVRSMCIGISAHQKLDRLQKLICQLGYESLAIFGDCFDEVSLLDPVVYPQAIKCFAREVCRNDLLNFGRLHFFFPDSRLALDLNTDKTLKEARFDRHFVRDLVWSRHQLEELAERRFRASQRQQAAAVDGMVDTKPKANMSFNDLFMAVRGEDFASYVGKLATPRELLIMMTEMFARIEANPEGKLTAQDMEIAVTKAQEQAV